MKVCVFTPDYNAKLTAILEAFAEGIPGAEVHSQSTYVNCDIAVVFGTVKKAYAPTLTKQPILDRHRGRRLIIIESAFLLRGDYYQIGWGGFAGHGDFRNKNVPADRWEQLPIKSRPWKRDETGPVIVCGQLPRDTTVQDTDHVGWCQRTVEYYVAQGLETWFRPHPRIEDPAVYGVNGVPRDTEDLRKSFQRARCMVTWNSTTAVEAAVKGVPIIACDSGSFAWPVANRELSDIYELRRPSRRQWLAGLGYAQWTVAEMRDGLPWRHLTRR